MFSRGKVGVIDFVLEGFVCGGEGRKFLSCVGG